MNRTRTHRWHWALEHKLTAALIIASLPMLFMALYLLWSHAEFSWHMRVFLSAVMLLPWLFALLWQSSRITQQWRVLVNVAESVRLGDYGFRIRGAQDPGALGELVRELNSLAEQLRQQRLHALEQQLLVDKIIRDIDVAIFAFDHRQRLTLANRLALRLLQAPLENVRGQSAEALGLKALLELDHSRTIEHQFAGQTGQWNVRVDQYREQGLPHYLLFVSDLQHLLRREEQKLWTRLIRVLSHEVNNSLSPIISISESLRSIADRSDSEAIEDTQQGLHVIQERASSLTRFVQRYAELARLPTPQCQSQDLRRVLTGLQTMAEGSALEMDIAPSPLPVFIDAGQIQQALLNLLKNAREASDTPQTIALRAQTQGQHIQLQIIDQGKGIANTSNLFVPLYTTKPGGSGIGLLICRQIIEAHGGSLTLRNRDDGPGCIAEMLLPRAAV